MTTSAQGKQAAEALSLIGSFARVDFFGAVAGLGLVLFVNGLFLREQGVWLILPFLLVTSGLLWLSTRRVEEGEAFPALALIAIANWVAAIAVAVLFPFLWPLMVLTVVMPLILATPFLDTSQLVPATAATAFVAGVMAIAGLLNDDGGVIEDIDDDLELLVVAGGLAAHMIPIALIVREHNRFQHGALERTTSLNHELVASEADLVESRRRVVEAGDRERSRIERDLHDGAQQRLVALRLRLQQLADQAGENSDLRDLAIDAVDDVAAAIEELRELANGIYPPVLEAGGLGAALGAIARRSESWIDIEVVDLERYGAPVESAVYFTALEAVTNAAKHAPEGRVTLRLAQVTSDGHAALHLVVADDGPGFDIEDAGRGSSGLVNMADRVGAVRGTLDVESTVGSGTTITAVVPVN